MQMRVGVGSLLVMVAVSVFTLSVGGVAHGGHTPPGGGPVDDGQLFSEFPVEGVRIVREEDYPKRPSHYLSSNLYTTLAHGRETGNRFCAFDFQVPDGGGPLPHTHRNEWETFFVHPRQAPVTFTVGVAPEPPFNFIEQEIPDGAVVYGPQCPVHGFINQSGQFSRIFSFVLPCGLENFFLTSGDPVVDYFAPIPEITQEEIVRTAFWAEQRGDALHFPGVPAPMCPADTPDHVVSSITGEDLTDPSTPKDRPRVTGPFGEERVSLLTRAEVGSITGATAFCGPGAPGRRQGGTVDYAYVSLSEQEVFPPAVTSQNTEVFYTLGGILWFIFSAPGSGDEVIVRAPPLTYVEIQPGVVFSMANLGAKRIPRERRPAESLVISVINDCPPPSSGEVALGQRR